MKNKSIHLLSQTMEKSELYSGTAIFCASCTVSQHGWIVKNKIPKLKLRIVFLVLKKRQNAWTTIEIV